MEISPSILASNFARLGEEVRKLEEFGADYVHLDVMDGQFVRNITFGAPVIKAVRAYTKLPFDVHLMIEEPMRYLEDFASAGADIITIHVEAQPDVAGAIREIKKRGVKCGLSVKPGTGIESVLPYMNEIDLVLVMTVEPGFGGQAFMEEMMTKVRALKEVITRENLAVKIEVDGGIDARTAGIARAAGADICVAGTAVFGAKDMKEAISKIKSAGWRVVAQTSTHTEPGA